MASVEDTLTLSLLGVECLFGEVADRVGASHWLDPARRTCNIRGGTKAGRGLVKLFTGFVTRGLGPDAVRVERVPAASERGGARHV
jgi:hypothetical protein